MKPNDYSYKRQNNMAEPISHEEFLSGEIFVGINQSSSILSRFSNTDTSMTMRKTNINTEINGKLPKDIKQLNVSSK